MVVRDPLLAQFARCCALASVLVGVAACAAGPEKPPDTGGGDGEYRPSPCACDEIERWSA